MTESEMMLEVWLYDSEDEEGCWVWKDKKGDVVRQLWFISGGWTGCVTQRRVATNEIRNAFCLFNTFEKAKAWADSQPLVLG